MKNIAIMLVACFSLSAIACSGAINTEPSEGEATVSAEYGALGSRTMVGRDANGNETVRIVDNGLSFTAYQGSKEILAGDIHVARQGQSSIFKVRATVGNSTNTYEVDAAAGTSKLTSGTGEFDFGALAPHL